MNKDQLNTSYRICVKFYNDVFREYCGWRDIDYFIEKYITNREALRGTCLNKTYKDGGRFEYVTILEKIGVYRNE